MTDKKIPSERKQAKVQPPKNKAPDKKPAEGSAAANPLAGLQHQVGNQAVQRLVAQRQSGPGEADEETSARINQMRGGGDALDGKVQREMGSKMGADFSGVRVHTSPDADDLNKRLGARAFTTGQDIFFRNGEYAPGTSGGNELLGHELTHVVQQRAAGEREPAAKMVVNPPDDAYEREADQVAKQVTSPGAVQAQEEEELVQGKAIQRAIPDEEELVQGKALQRAIPDEEELVQGKALPPGQALQSNGLQRAGVPEEEELVQGKPIQSNGPGKSSGSARR